MITIETERILFISRRSETFNLWCERCGKEVAALTVEEAALAMRTSVDETIRKIEGGQLHCLHAPGSGLRICANSLP